MSTAVSCALSKVSEKQQEITKLPKDPACPRSAHATWYEPSGERCTVPAEIIDETDGGAVISMRRTLTCGQKLFLWCDQMERRAVAQHCVARGTDFLVTLQFVLHERRNNDRLATTGSGTLQWADRSGRRCVANVTVSNATIDGAQIELDEPVGVQQTVELFGEAWTCIGDVRYCRRDKRGFVAGIRFDRSPRPSRR